MPTPTCPLTRPGRLATTLDLGDGEPAFGTANASGRRPLILLATNGSPSASDATKIAGDLAGMFHAALRIVHVVTPVEYRVGRLAPMRPVEQELDCPYESPVLLKARRLAWNHGAAASLQLVAGEPARAIVAAAEQSHADLLVIGGQDYRVAARLRARTRRLVEPHAGCPVLVCPAAQTIPEGREAARKLIEQIGRDKAWSSHHRRSNTTSALRARRFSW